VIFDIHSDVAIDVHARRARGERNVLAGRHLPMWRAGSVAGSVCVVGGDAGVLCPHGLGRPWESALALLRAMEDDVAESEGAVAIVRSAAEALRAIDGGAFAIVLGLEGAMPIGRDLKRIEALYERGLRTVGLTWNSRNVLATGLGAGDGGLTALGAEAVGLMNDLGIAVDLAHSTPETYRDVLAVTRSPVLVSHANASAVWRHPRNLEDGQLAALRENGGVVGAVLYPDFVGGGEPTVDQVLDHVEHLMEVAGDGAVAIGADFIEPCGPAVLAELYPGVEDPQAPPFPGGIKDPAGLGALLDALARRGHDEDVVEGVGFANFLRLLDDVARDRRQ
jgi:membrane dipeptidase